MKIIFKYVAVLVLESLIPSIGMETKNVGDLINIGEIRYSEKESSAKERFDKVETDSQFVPQIRVKTETKNITEIVKKRVNEEIMNETGLQSNVLKIVTNNMHGKINETGANKNSTTSNNLSNNLNALLLKRFSNSNSRIANNEESGWDNGGNDILNDTYNDFLMQQLLGISNKTDNSPTLTHTETDPRPIYVNATNVHVFQTATKEDTSQLIEKNIELEQSISSLQEVITNINEGILDFNNKLHLLEQKEIYIEKDNLELRKAILSLQKENFKLTREKYLLIQNLSQIERRLEESTNYDLTLLNNNDNEQEIDMQIIKEKIEYLEEKIKENSEINSNALTVSPILFIDLLISLTYNSPYIPVRFKNSLQKIKDRHLWAVKNGQNQLIAISDWEDLLADLQTVPPSQTPYYYVNSRFSELNDENTNKYKQRTSLKNLFTTDVDKKHKRHNNKYYKRSSNIQPTKNSPKRFNPFAFLNPSAILNPLAYFDPHTKLENIHQLQRPSAKSFLKYGNNGKHIYENYPEYTKDYLNDLLTGQGYSQKNSYKGNNKKDSKKYIYGNDPEYAEDYLNDMLIGKGHSYKNKYKGNNIKDGKEYIDDNDPAYPKNYLKDKLTGQVNEGSREYIDEIESVEENFVKNSNNHLYGIDPALDEKYWKDIMIGHSHSDQNNYQENVNKDNTNNLYENIPAYATKYLNDKLTGKVDTENYEKNINDDSIEYTGEIESSEKKLDKGSNNHFFGTNPATIENIWKDMIGHGHSDENNYQENVNKDITNHLYEINPTYKEDYLKDMLAGQADTYIEDYKENINDGSAEYIDKIESAQENFDANSKNHLYESDPAYAKDYVKDMMIGESDTYFDEESQNRGNPFYSDSLKKNNYYKQPDRRIERDSGQNLKDLYNNIQKMTKKEVKTNNNNNKYYEMLRQSISTTTKNSPIFKIIILSPNYNNRIDDPTNAEKEK